VYRKPLALLLVFSWILLAGFDLLEDLDVPLQTRVHNPFEGSLPNVASGANIVNNIVESADYTQPFYTALNDFPAVDSAIETALSFKKASRLHKLNRVFLI
jgi:hypothetical protein